MTEDERDYFGSILAIFLVFTGLLGAAQALQWVAS